MDETSEQVVALINDASIMVDKDEKIKLLRQVEELTVHKQPELLDNFFEEILQFQTDTNKEVRIQVIAFVEIACKKDPGLLPKAVGMFSHLLNDSNAAVKKRVVLANTNLYRIILARVAQTKSTKGDLELWESMTQIQGEIRTLVSDKNDGVKTAVLKFLEMQILSQSLRTSLSEIKKSDAGLEIVPINHPILNVEKLRKEGQNIFDLLVSKFDDGTTTPLNIQALISLLGSIARLRPTFMDRVLTTLIKLYSKPPIRFSQVNIQSINRKLKGSLISLLKHPASADAHEQLVPLLEQLEVPNSTIVQYDQRGQMRRRDDETSDVQSSKRRRYDPEVEYQRLRNALPFDILVDLVMRSMSNLPDKMPDGFTNRPQDVRTQQQQPPSTSNTNNITTTTTAKSTSSTPLLSTANAGADIDNASKPKLTAREVLAKRKRDNDDHDVVIERKHKKPFKLSPNVLTKPESKKMTVSAFRRVLSTEGRLTQRGAKRDRVLLISRMASALDEPELVGELIAFILRVPKDRTELALVWLYHLHQRYIALAGAGEQQLRAKERYDMSVANLFAGLKEDLDVDDFLFSRMLLEMPHFTSGTLNMVQSYCEEKARCRLGFMSLRDLILHRPPVRSECLSVLLSYTSRKEPEQRILAIRVCKTIAAIPSIHTEIQQFAVAGLKKLTTADGDATMTPEDMKASLHLFLDQCVKTPRLVSELVQIFPKLRKEAIRPVLESIKDAVKKIEWNKANLEMIANYPSGSEILILAMLRHITDVTGGKPSVDVVATVRAMFDRNKNPRFLIPILRGLSKNEIVTSLPSLLALPDKVMSQVIDRIIGTQTVVTNNVGSSALSASELLVALHKETLPTKDGVRALNYCLIQPKPAYTTEVLAAALQQLVDQTPLPLLFMRTAIQSLKAAPKLKGFVVSLLNRLLSKKVWKDTNMWKGFVKCCQLTTPQSLDVLLRLDIVQLASAFDIESSLRDKLTAHIKKLPTQQLSVLKHSQPAICDLLGIKRGQAKGRHEDMFDK